MFHYFLANFYFSPKDSPSKAMKNVFYFIKKALCSEDIYFPFFFYLSAIALAWSKINLKVYDVISCLNKYLIAHFVWYLEEEKTMMLKLCPLIEYYIRNIFMEKSCRKYVPKASPRPLFYFGKLPKIAIVCKKFFQK